MNFVRLRLIYPENVAKEPIICNICKNFNIIVNIKMAKVTQDSAILNIEIDGDIEEIEKAMKFMQEKGIDVQPIEGQIFTE
ncbi:MULTISPECIES: NIL domain-containing protein [unclassified Hydrogenobaculum]|uniref:NIL domain-containing protein n=1 Tax=unclassified Hydrogenobaculum TaxID=2622382 RepID=UPI0001C529D0|nr:MULTISPECIES: NIL domain-containing protein [unclassified Hydrogenobaculum]AEF18783.1 NIL domain-containing protein [Hydrogenobaculum sp. 3684]AEG46071.1 NIL domain-containing protein [Hydrogenobaculum sp. SHO]AGG14715.1 NIL domain containing protein [Hydrogenobaculum sp. HO]AGH93014.1 ABC-type metal ion transport system, ATPase component [Hydrogenobaculum sp. SN]